MEAEPTQQKSKTTRRFWKIFKIGYLTSIHLLALFALFMISVALASKFKLTNTKGNIDVNNRYFDEMAGKYNQGFKVDSSTIANQDREIIQKIGVLAQKYPYNAKIILEAFEKNKDRTIALRMLDATTLALKDDAEYVKKFNAITQQKEANTLSAFPFSNYAEWKDFSRFIKNDKKAIDSVAKITGVEARLIVMCLVGEQIRMFNSSRENFKNLTYKYNRIILPTNRGYGVTGILEHTALRIEKTLFDTKSPFFPGEYYQQCIDFNDSLSPLMNDTIEAHKYPTIQRLIRGGDHFYSYLYTALFLRQLQSHWEKSGYSLAYRPEILGTLFNLGYQKSKPNPHPQVGGSSFTVGEKEYTFGGLCFDFYYSGELMDLFPLTSEPFTPTEVLEKTIVFPERDEEKDTEIEIPTNIMEEPPVDLFNKKDSL